MSIQYIHQAIYGNMGHHAAEPQYIVRGKEVFATSYNRDMPADKPLFTILGGKWYPTEFHPGGESPHAFFETHGDKIHTTLFNPDHNPARHAFEMSSSLTR